ncbi:L,D-transpeptidase family protein [Mucilaginibacter psychrotolerans]|uniref:Murein L,D-transpeptidase n=1 Tax=Mucilaginibacter psychrotolerans TaxID=1524096 RepID=A0A4Y8SHL6_9SPHI|nr:L,D-transpeptidase family protein [Mucilaginibacter psychrotolerans]TFF38529.1 murein L,D-transpeptidase [Mucilaginibacter psychrotolerans]
MKIYAIKSLIIGAATCASLAGCGQGTPKPATSMHRDTAIAVIPFDSLQIAGFFKRYPLLAENQTEVAGFYRQRNFTYAWFSNGLLIEQASNLTSRVLNFKSDGLSKSSPYQRVLDSLINEAKPNVAGHPPEIEAELMLTAQYFNFSKSVYQGIDVSASKASGWLLPRKKVAYAQYLDSLLKTPGKQLAAKEPVYRQYELLRTYLRKYSLLAANDKWLPITLSKKPALGDTAAAIQLLRARLYKLEDFSDDTLKNSYDPEIQSGIKVFQERHGLPGNGLLNKETLAELNVPLSARIKQILVNMERSRWLPVSLDADYVAVNIPEFKMHVYHADSLLWSCSVVVGKSEHPTTAFYGEIKYVVFSPYWNVPHGILVNEVIPGMNRNGNYLRNHNMEITGHSDGLPVVRQKPGKDNSLGLVKFLFPNSYNIYLHDTPSKSLFGETSRAFSHGCIRIAQPAKLAAFLLKDNTTWTDAKISRYMHAGKERYVTLNKKVPVFIAYFTAFTDRAGHLNFRKDIYNLDGRLAEILLSETDVTN